MGVFRYIFSSAYLLLPLATLMWAGNTVAGKMAVGEIPPFMLTTLRWLMACAVLAVLAAPGLKRDWPVIRERILYLLFMGMMGFGLFSIILYTATTMTTAINVAIMQGAFPALVAVLNLICFRFPLQVRYLLGIGVAAIGVITIASGGSLKNLYTLTFNNGDLVMFLALLTYSIYILGLKFKPAMSWMSFLFVLGCSAALTSIPFSIYEYAQGARVNWSGQSVAILLYVALLPSIVSQLCFAKAVELVGANKAAMAINLVPVFGAFLSVMILGEVFRFYHFFSLVMVVAGVLISARTVDEAKAAKLQVQPSTK